MNIQLDFSGVKISMFATKTVSSDLWSHMTKSIHDLRLNIPSPCPPDVGTPFLPFWTTGNDPRGCYPVLAQIRLFENKLNPPPDGLFSRNREKGVFHSCSRQQIFGEILSKSGQIYARLERNTQTDDDLMSQTFDVGK